MPPRALLPTGPSARPLHRLFTTSLPRHAEPEGKLTTMGVRAELLKAKRENMVRDFKNWVENQGEQFKWPAPEGYNYLGAYDAKTGYAHRKEAREGEEGNSQRVPLVFPENKNFKVDPVLSDDFKDKIYEMVMQKNFSVRAVSMLHGVSLERVAAVVRLKQIERDMLAEKKPIATFLTKYLHKMMPVTEYKPPTAANKRRHEVVQALPAHPFAGRQAFVLTSESREFGRADAAEEFSLPTPEQAVPIPTAVLVKKDMNSGMSRDDAVALAKQRDQLELEKKRELMTKREEELKKTTKVVSSGRYKWRLIEAETGKVGFRYGVPHMDRKKGQVKIPTRVDAI